MPGIIDAHHHLWQYNMQDYNWMDDSMSILKRDYLPEDLLPLTKKAGVEGSVVVQARQSIEETEWLLQQARKYPFIKGVVGWVDLQSDQLQEQLERFALDPLLVGVRHVIHDEPDESFMLRENFLRGMRLLEKYVLTYDLLLFPVHLTYAQRLVEKLPGIRFVLDHIAKPDISEGLLNPWREDIKALAKFSNVYCKVSGMVTEAKHHKWTYEDLLPYLDTVTEAFGTERLMIGSDWPVCLLSSDYEEVLDIPGTYFSSFSESDREKIFSANCLECYGIS